MRFSVVAPMFMAVIIVGLSGCGKLPSWAELNGEKKAPVAEPTAPTTDQPTVAAPVAPAAPTAFEVIAQFKALRPAQISDSDINRLTSLSEGLDQITEINADGSAVTNQAFGAIDKLTNLRQLRLNRTRIDNEACLNIGKVSSLEVLALSYTAVNDLGVVALSNLVNLRQLELSNCQVALNGFTTIGSLPALVSLELNSTNLDNRGLREVCNCKTLTTLKLNGNSIDDSGLDALKKLDSLETLEIGTSKIGGIGLQHVTRKLKSLAVNHCNLGDPSVKAINQFKSLERLDLSGIPLLNDGNFSSMVKGMKELKYLKLTGIKLFNGDGLKALQSCHQIEEIQIDQCKLLGDVPAIAILKSLKSLKRLNVNGTMITANGLQQLRSENSELVIQ